MNSETGEIQSESAETNEAEQARPEESTQLFISERLMSIVDFIDWLGSV